VVGTAGGTQLWNIDAGSDFAWSFRVPAAALRSSGGVITIETDQFFRPADRGKGADKRALGLRVYLVKLRPAS
jgi:outer membrane protein assembly factor BamB